MATFIYKAKNHTGQTVTGQVKAEDQEDAVRIVSNMGLVPVSIINRSDAGFSKMSGASGRVKIKEQYIFSRQVANLLRAGVSLIRALDIISERMQNPYFKRVISNIRLGIEHGRSFSECLSDFPNIFSPLYIAMVHAGEESSNLQEMLVNISLYQKRQSDLLSKLRGAIAYPIFMAVFGMATIYFILTFVLPKMAGLFSGLGESLPMATEILLKTSIFLTREWFYVLIVGGSLIFLIKKWVYSPRGHAALSAFLLNLPFLGDIVLEIEISRFCRTLVLLLKGGVSIIRALDISISLLGNEIIKKDLEECRDELTSGGSFGESLKHSTRIPVTVGHMIAVGEESSNLKDVLSEIAEDFEQQADEKIKVFTTLLEPAMILLVGLVIGFIVFAILLPVFQVDVFAR